MMYIKRIITITQVVKQIAPSAILTMTQHKNKIKVIPMEIQLPQVEQSERPWMKFAGVFKDDPDFDTVQQYIQEYRQELDAALNLEDFNLVQYGVNKQTIIVGE